MLAPDIKKLGYELTGAVVLKWIFGGALLVSLYAAFPAHFWISTLAVLWIDAAINCIAITLELQEQTFKRFVWHNDLTTQFGMAAIANGWRPDPPSDEPDDFWTDMRRLTNGDIRKADEARLLDTSKPRFWLSFLSRTAYTVVGVIFAAIAARTMAA